MEPVMSGTGMAAHWTKQTGLSELYGRQTHSTCWHLLLKTSPLPLPTQRSMGSVLYCAYGPLLFGCGQPGSLGLWYFILTYRSDTVNFAPMLLIWLSGSIRIWRIDLMSHSFLNMPCGTGYVSQCRSWQPMGSQEPWLIKGHRDDSDCFYVDCVEVGHF